MCGNVSILVWLECGVTILAKVDSFPLYPGQRDLWPHCIVYDIITLSRPPLFVELTIIRDGVTGAVLSFVFFWYDNVDVLI